jgi:hypothetical protein
MSLFHPLYIRSPVIIVHEKSPPKLNDGERKVLCTDTALLQLHFTRGMAGPVEKYGGAMFISLSDDGAALSNNAARRQRPGRGACRAGDAEAQSSPTHDEMSTKESVRCAGEHSQTDRRQNQVVAVHLLTHDKVVSRNVIGPLEIGIGIEVG